MISANQSELPSVRTHKRNRLLRFDHLIMAAVFTLVIAALLWVANIGMDVLTSMRAYVGGEGLWSKGQKDAVYYLVRYGKSRSNDDYERYLKAIAIPLADHDARVELQKATPDLDLVRNAFIAGSNHPDDVPGMITLVRRYGFEPHIGHAVRVWAQADEFLQELSRLGSLIREELGSPTPDESRLNGLLAQVDGLSVQF